MRDTEGRQHWMLYEGGRGGAPAAHVARFESLGLYLPEKRLTTDELLGSTAHHTNIDLERLTGIRERRVCSEGEDSFSLAVSAAKDCLARSHHSAEDLEMLICCSISKNKGGIRHRLEPPLSLSIKEAIGARRARSFDVSNACAGMVTGVFILNDFIRRGVIRRGMVVSGEYISNLGANAAKTIRSILSPELASLTLGDAGVAAIVERAKPGVRGIRLVGFSTLSEHSRLCIGLPAKVGPGAAMYTKARTIHRVAMEDAPALVSDALAELDLHLSSIDYAIPHQTSKRAIEKGAKELAEKLGAAPKHFVENVAERGNTASTTHFVALHEYLSRGRFQKGDEILLISVASGLEVGLLVFEMDELVEQHVAH
ncbi:MAG TPA: 3-oxoacyl-[acyl-carrier-protein] synthase III C-terminal domain-containing protein [Polyangiaceae bacterium]|nr:3-oxoacyl-[acyl-carrier-protein] synthase III C-terminal domain-containing protein [Polyangiaceae bacterium]